MSTLALGPELTIAQAASAREALLQALHSGSDALALDLSSVTDFDSAGVQLLLAARLSLHAQGHALRVQPSAVVSDALRCLGLDDLMAAHG